MASPSSSSSSPVLKIAVVGPKGCGKTRLANHLAEVADFGSEFQTEPTIGVRIVERHLRVSDGSEVLCELWDVSGDHQFEGCWPAICDGLQGLVLVYDPNSKSQTSEIKVWAEWFAKQSNIAEGRIVAFALNNSATNAKSWNIKISDTQSLNVASVAVNLLRPDGADGEKGPSVAQQQFAAFVEKLRQL